jgi:KUP system potassium uptake protein
LAQHLIYLTTSNSPERIEAETILSILKRTPKRADVYWFIHVETDDEPFMMRYKVEPLRAFTERRGKNPGMARRS